LKRCGLPPAQARQQPLKGSALFSEHFAFELPAIVNVVGAGGKTGLIGALASEYSEKINALFTTTTRIHPPGPEEGFISVASENPELLKLVLERAACICFPGTCKFLAAVPTHLPNYLLGVSPEFGPRLDRAVFPLILNEADGAKSMSIKAPRENEPVLMKGARYLVPVIGLDCINQPLGPQTVFRWELAASRFGLQAGKTLTPDVAARILLHPEGVCRDWRAGTEIIPYINKADKESDDALAQQLARALLQHGKFPVKRVVWGSVEKRRANSALA
jgi:probable selenium-dependent hydroxylase accessory protein YqeC